MDRIRISAALLPALLLMACDRSPRPADQPGSAPAASNAAAPTTDSAAAPEAAPPPPPPRLTPEAERGVEGARGVLLGFARAIERRDYGQAWALLGPADRQKWSRAAFAAMFADLDKVSVAIPTGTTEGAAGSVYYTAPVAISGSDADGRPIRLEGSAVLRRVNDVDGASPAQLRWHFDTLTLDWTH